MVVIKAMRTRMVKSPWWMMPALSPTFSTINSVRPLVFTSAAIITDCRRT